MIHTVYPSVLPERKGITRVYKDLYRNVKSSFIPKSEKKTKTAQIPDNGKMDE